MQYSPCGLESDLVRAATGEPFAIIASTRSTTLALALFSDPLWQTLAYTRRACLL